MDTVTKRLFLAWVSGCGDELLPEGLVSSHSDDGGLTWSPPRPVGITAGLPLNEAPVVAIGPLGQLYLAWRDIQSGAIMFGLSADSGRTWLTAPASLCACQQDYQTYTGTRGYRFFSVPVMAVDTSLGANHGSIYLAFVDVSHQRGMIRVIASRTGGFEWSLAVPVNDIATLGSGAGGLASLPDDLLPAISVGPDGHVHIIYYTTREGGGSGSMAFILKLNVFYAHSVDGMIWDPNLRLTAAAFDPALSQDEGGHVSVGDHIGVAATAERAYAVWMDTRSGAAMPTTATVQK
jgi:hypothetical protein